MDVLKRLKAVKTFQNYMDISQDIASKPKSLQNVQLNMSNIIALKSVRSLEIEVNILNKHCIYSFVSHLIIKYFVFSISTSVMIVE